MIKLQRLNVLKEVDSEDKAKKLEELGFKRLDQAAAPEEKKEKGKDKKNPEGKGDPGAGGDNNGSGANGEDNNGGNGKPEA